MGDVVGVDVGGTRIRATRRGDTGPPLTADTPGELDRLAAAILAVVARVDPDPAAIGIGCAGLVDHRSGVVRWTPHATGRDADVAASVAARWDVPIWVDNDANAAALAEARTGAGAGHGTVLTITVGTGIGAGLTIDGALVRGRGHLGEVGHLQVAPGPECACGRLGCWEELASGRALDRAAAGIRAGTDGRRLVEQAAAGDAAAGAALEEMGRWLAVGIADLALILDPDIIVLGGIVPSIGDPLMESVRRHLDAAGGSLDVVGAPPVVVATHGDRAGLEGAMMGAEEVL